jgi:hypothetical protein
MHVDATIPSSSGKALREGRYHPRSCLFPPRKQCRSRSLWSSCWRAAEGSWWQGDLSLHRRRRVVERPEDTEGFSVASSTVVVGCNRLCNPRLLLRRRLPAKSSSSSGSSRRTEPAPTRRGAVRPWQYWHRHPHNHRHETKKKDQLMSERRYLHGTVEITRRRGFRCQDRRPASVERTAWLSVRSPIERANEPRPRGFLFHARGATASIGTTTKRREGYKDEALGALVAFSSSEGRDTHLLFLPTHAIPCSLVGTAAVLP